MFAMNGNIILVIVLNLLYLICNGLPQYKIEGEVAPSSFGQITWEASGANSGPETLSSITSGNKDSIKADTKTPSTEDSSSGGWVAPTPSDSVNPKFDLNGLNISELAKVGALTEYKEQNTSKDESFLTTVHERKITKIDLTKLTEFQNAIIKLSEAQKAAEAKRKEEAMAMVAAMNNLKEQARVQAQAQLDARKRAENEARLKAMQMAYFQMQQQPKITLSQPINLMINNVYQSLMKLESLPNVMTQPLPNNIRNLITNQPIPSSDNIDISRLHDVQALIYKLCNARVLGYKGENPLTNPLNTMLTSVDSVLNRLQQIIINPGNIAAPSASVQ